jgi:hypothetical protein
MFAAILYPYQLNSSILRKPTSLDHRARVSSVEIKFRIANGDFFGVELKFVCF